MIKKSKLSSFIALMFLAVLTSCDSIPAYQKQGYTFEVVYDLGEGIYNGSNRNTNNISLFYQPGSYITDLSKIRDYEFIHEPGHNCTYELEGWYFDKEFTNKVNFDEYTLPNEQKGKVTLYANWKAIYDKYFNVHYLDHDGNIQTWTEDGKEVFSHQVRWEINKPFEFDSSLMEYPSDKVFTYIQAYQDENLTIPVDNQYTLTDSEDEISKNVYLKWIEGDYDVVETASQLRQKLKSGASIYLNADIDMNDLSNPNLTYSSILENVVILGNNHTISNLKCSTYTGASMVKAGDALVGALAGTMKNVTIKDLSFENVTFEIDRVICSNLYVSTLAGNIENSIITNVEFNFVITYASSIDEVFVSQGKLREKYDMAAYNIDDDSIIECDLNKIEED